MRAGGGNRRRGAQRSRLCSRLRGHLRPAAPARARASFALPALRPARGRRARGVHGSGVARGRGDGPGGLRLAGPGDPGWPAADEGRPDDTRRRRGVPRPLPVASRGGRARDVRVRAADPAPPAPGSAGPDVWSPGRRRRRRRRTHEAHHRRRHLLQSPLRIAGRRNTERVPQA